MPDTLTSISHLINSPPGQLAAGGVWQAIAVQFGFGLGLFYGVTKVFDLVGDRLNEDTKLEIAVWLLGVKVSQKLEPWPDTFARVFDRVFGKKHLSWKCFWRSCVASSIMTLFGLLLFLGLYRQDESSFPATFGGISLDWSFRWWINEVLVFLPLAVVANAFPDYLSLLKTRYLLGSIHGGPWRGLVSVAIDLMVTGVLSLSSAGILGLLYPVTTDYVLALGRLTSLVWHTHAVTPLLYPMFPLSHILSCARLLLTQQWGIVFFYPAFFTTIWTVLYAGSGFLLKAARRFDIGFEWFNRKFDIEKKPLQSIGFVAGALVAIAYWAVVIVSRVVG